LRGLWIFKPIKLHSDQANFPLVKASHQDLPDLLDFIATSQLLKDMRGLFGSGWQFLKLDQTQLAARMNAGQIVIFRDAGKILAMSVIEKRAYDQNLVICYADGLKTPLIKLLNAICQSAGSEKLALVSARLPLAARIISVFQAAGFQPAQDEPYWIFEKHLTDSGSNTPIG